jgi:predicted transcriptional regulator
MNALSDNVRKQLIISGQLDNQIDALARSKGTNVSEIMRRALALYIRANELEGKGMSLGFARDPAKLDTQVVGL